MNVGPRFLTHFSRLTLRRSPSNRRPSPRATAPPGRPAHRPRPADPAIAAALPQVSPDHIQANIAKLVTFNNRSTLSSLDTDLPPNTGVLAASDWIESEFTRISAACNNCLEVHRDDFIEPPSHRPRRPHHQAHAHRQRLRRPQRLRPRAGRRAASSSPATTTRATPPTPTPTTRPGANDDASGVAVSLECARVLSELKFPSSLVFVAVAGEEQGLNGSATSRASPRSEGWQLEAVLNNDIVGGDTTPGQAAAKTNPPSASSPRASPPPPPSSSSTPSRPSAPKATRPRANSPAPSSTSPPPTSIHLRSASPPARPRPARTTCMRLVPAFHPVLIFRRDRFLRGGDHTSFNHEGFAAVRFTEWRENFDHQHQNVRVENGIQYGDLLQFVDFDYVANVARLNAATLATLASPPAAAKRPRRHRSPRQQHQAHLGSARRLPRRRHLRDRLARHRPARSGPTSHPPAPPPQSPCPSPRTTSSSASAPSTPPATAASPSTHAHRARQPVPPTSPLPRRQQIAVHRQFIEPGIVILNLSQANLEPRTLSNLEPANLEPSTILTSNVHPARPCL